MKIDDVVIIKDSHYLHGCIGIITNIRFNPDIKQNLLYVFIDNYGTICILTNEIRIADDNDLIKEIVNPQKRMIEVDIKIYMHLYELCMDRDNRTYMDYYENIINELVDLMCNLSDNEEYERVKTNARFSQKRPCMA